MPIIRSSRVVYRWSLPVVFSALVFRLSVWCGAEGYVCVCVCVRARARARERERERVCEKYLESMFQGKIQHAFDLIRFFLAT